MAIRKYSPAMLDASREKLGIPENWVWRDCEGNCGEIVWISPDDAGFESFGVPVVFVCSTRCARSVR